MENTITLPSALLEEKSMYVKINREKVEKLNKMIALLNKRKELANNGESVLTEYERNERAIIVLRTDYELAKHHKNAQAITKEIDGYIEKASEILTEMGEKWNEVIAKAKRDAVQKKDIAQIIKSMDDVDFEVNVDVKINYYLQLKSMVYNQGNPTMKKV